jgi:hypothetical protein
MKNKEFMKKVYRHFGDFVAVASARELEYLVMDARYTSGFSMRIKEVIDDIRRSGREIAEFSVLFNTDGDIAIIDANIVGRFVADRYCVIIEDYYKDASLNKIIRSVVNGNDKVQKDFLTVSYKILYDTLEEIYRDIKCRRDILNGIKENFNLSYYNREDVSVVAASLMILEDICKYIGISGELLRGIVNDNQSKRFSQEQ